MKAKVKELYQKIKPFYQLAQEIGIYALDYDGSNDEQQEYWDDAGQAAESIEEAIDTLQEILDDY